MAGFQWFEGWVLGKRRGFTWFWTGALDMVVDVMGLV